MRRPHTATGITRGGVTRQPPRRVTESYTGHIPAGAATLPSARLSRRALTLFPEGPCMLDCGIRLMYRYRLVL
eukprot:4696323-Prymnesium_polylepis.2